MRVMEARLPVSAARLVSDRVEIPGVPCGAVTHWWPHGVGATPYTVSKMDAPCASKRRHAAKGRGGGCGSATVSKNGRALRDHSAFGAMGRRGARYLIENRRVMHDQNAFGGMEAALCHRPGRKMGAPCAIKTR